MRLRLLLVLLVSATLPSAVRAAGATADTCLLAAEAAERAWELPAGLLAAIGQVESGRRVPSTGRLEPWPWSVNAEGVGRAFDTLAEAVAFVRAAQARGTRLIDVGCFQIDLFYHGAAFSSLEQAFDAWAGADYAARLLAGLHARAGRWPDAVAAYHSAAPAEGEAYRRKVVARLDVDASPSALAVAYGAPGRADPVVILASASARAVRVFRLTAAGWQTEP